MNGVGIDFGTTNSCIAYCKGLNTPAVTVNVRGRPYTPTRVSYEHQNDNIIIGINQILDATTIHSIKRLIGKKYNDPVVQSYIPNFHFPVVQDVNGYCAFKVISNGQEQIVSPELAASMVLKYLVTEYNRTQIRPASNKFVLTIPVAFKHDQKERILFAAQQAGLEVITTIYEPIAAAISHDFMNPIDADVLVFDFGGGTLDVTVMHINTQDQQNSSFNVLGTAGDADLGGENIDQILCEYFENEMKNKGHNIRSNDEARLYRNLQILKDTSKELKELLSEATSAEFLFNNGEIAFQTTLRRKKFETILEGKNIPERIKKCIDDSLTAAEINKDKIKNVICVGGSSNIPMVKDLLEEYFEDGKKILIGQKPEEDIARGASIYAKYVLDGNNVINSGDKIKTLQPGIVYPNGKTKSSGIVIHVETRLNYSVGYVDSEGFDEIFEKGAVVPQTREIEVGARQSGQRDMHTVVCYKDEPTDDPVKLKKFIIDFGNIPESRTEMVAEKWTIDAGGNLNIKSVVKSSGKEYDNTVRISNIFFTQDQLNDMSQRMIGFSNRLDVQGRFNAIDAEATRLLSSAQRRSRNHPKRIEIQRQLNDIETWFEDQADNDNRSVIEYENMLNQLKNLIATYGL